MKSTHEKNEKNEKEEIEFPCLMKSKITTLVVIANKDNGGVFSGAVIKEDKDHSVGKYLDTWILDTFKPLPKGEQIILEN